MVKITPKIDRPLTPEEQAYMAALEKGFNEYLEANSEAYKAILFDYLVFGEWNHSFDADGKLVHHPIKST